MATFASPHLADYRGVQELVKDHIRALILRDELQPGQRIDQDGLAARFGVSRMPVREALRQLQVEGFVTFYPHRGVAVAQLSPEEIEELYVVRGALEGFAARLAVPRMSPEDLARLGAQVAEMERGCAAGHDAAFLEADRAFHVIIYSATGRPHLVRKIGHLWDHSVRYARTYFTLPGAKERATEKHREILQACEEHDASRAEQRVKENVLDTAHYVVGILREEGKEKK